MTEIPESVMQIADRITETILFEHVRVRRTSRRGAPSAIEMDVELVKLSIASALLAAEKRGEERERERLANMLDPEIGLPSDRLLRVIHADVETRGRKNNKFAVTVHHRNIVLSAVAAAIRKGSDQ